MTGKYLIIDNHLPVLIPDAMPHDRLREMNITSAGFFTVYTDTSCKLEICVHGHSESLGLKSKPEDAEKIKTFMQLWRLNR